MWDSDLASKISPRLGLYLHVNSDPSIGGFNIRPGKKESDVLSYEALLMFSLVHAEIMVHQRPTDNLNHQISNNHL